MNTKIKEIEQNKIYSIDDYYYVLGDCDFDKFDKDKIYIDSYSNISLE